MKRIISIGLSLILLLLASMPVFGIDRVLPEATEKKVDYINSTWINYDSGYEPWMIILTPYQGRDNINPKYRLSSDIKAHIKSELDYVFENIDSISAIPDTPDVNYKVKGLFYLSVTDGSNELLNSSGDTRLQLTIDPHLAEGERPVILVKSIDWELAPSIMEMDNTLTVFLNSFGPVLVLLPVEAEAAEAEKPVQNMNPVYEDDLEDPMDNFSSKPVFIIALISVFALMIAAYVYNHMESGRSNEFTFAFERLKLNIEIIIAKIRMKSMNK